MFDVWHKASKKESANMPPCPDGMTLPGWLSLILEKHCHFCGANGVRKVIWEFRTRACKNCVLESPAFLRVPIKDSDPGLNVQKLQDTLPFCLIHVPARYPEPDRTYRVFLEEDFDEFVTMEAGDEEEYAHWVGKRVSATRSIRHLGPDYRMWHSIFEEEQKDRRYQEGAQLRRGQIKTKLAEEGLMDVLKVFERDLAGRKSRFRDHPLFAKGGPLKDKEWKWIRPHVLGLLKDEGARM